MFWSRLPAAQNHVRTPTIARGRMLFFDDVVTFDPQGGPWGRGYLRADDHLTPDKWFFAGHFKNDPCMPGTMMLRGLPADDGLLHGGPRLHAGPRRLAL